MADIRDWGKFIRSRWDWARFGYQDGFPRGCQFTDLDAAVEFDGRKLYVECKQWDGTGIIPSLPPGNGQLRFLRAHAGLGRTVLIVYGCGVCDNPWAVHQVYRQPPDRFEDWRGMDLGERRKRFKGEIDHAMGLEARR